MDIKQLKKYGTNQLVLKIRKGEFTEEEKEIAIELLKERKFDLSTLEEDSLKEEETKVEQKSVKTPKSEKKKPEAPVKEVSTVPQVKPGSTVPQEVIDFIDKALEEDNTDLCSRIGVILGEIDDYENLSEEQVKLLLELRDNPNQEKPKKEKKEKKEKVKKESEPLTDEQNQIVLDESLSKSDKIRKLFDLGVPTKVIGEKIGISYNFVFNVIQRYKEKEKEGPKSKKEKVKKVKDSEETVEDSEIAEE